MKFSIFGKVNLFYFGLIIGALFLVFNLALAAKPIGAVKFVILRPSDGVVGSSVIVTVEAQKSNNQVDTSYGQDVTLVVSGSATGGGLVNIVNGTGSLNVGDLVAETVNLSLLDTQGTGLNVSSTTTLTFTSPTPAIWHQTNYWFRDDDGGEVSATGFGVADVPRNTDIINVERSTALRVRLSLRDLVASGSVRPRLEFKEGIDCGSGNWIPVTTTSRFIQLHFSPYFVNGDPTTQKIVNGSNFVPGQILESSNLASLQNLSRGDSSEYEWSIQTTNDIPYLASFALRLSNNGVPFDHYEKCAVLTVTTPPPPPVLPIFTVNKIVINDNGGTKQVSDFPLFVSGVPVVSGAANVLVAGTYQVYETGQSGYSFVFSGDCSSDGLITLNNGDNKTCTITNNDVQPKLTLVKTVINDNGGTKQVSDFPLFVSGVPVISGVVTGFNAGSYQVSEVQQSGYMASFWNGDCSVTGLVSLSLGENRICTITNNDFQLPPVSPATLQVVVRVVNDDLGTKQDLDFQVSVLGNNANPASFYGNDSGTTVTLDAGTYSVDESELSGYTKTFSGDCSGIVLAGENKICTIVNNDISQSVMPKGGGKPISLWISGMAYPEAQISLATTGVADSGLTNQDITVGGAGEFEVRRIGIFGDHYSFSLLIKDKEGRQTQTKVYNVDLSGLGSTFVVDDILVPPTVGLLRSSVTRGDSLRIMGFASPNNQVKVFIDQVQVGIARADAFGRYQLLVNTADLGFGSHTLQVKQLDLITKRESDFSVSRNFSILSLTVPGADFNDDGRVNIQDWSAFLALWKKQDRRADLDHNRKFDISDLSVFLRAMISYK